MLGPGNSPAFKAAEFGELSQVRKAGEDPYEIAPSLLTMREVLDLNRQLPSKQPEEPEAAGISPKEVQSYADLYRWYPPVPAAM